MSGAQDVASQRTLVAVVEALSELPLRGMDAAAVRERTGISRDRAYRTLATLESCGWAVRTGVGGWRLTPRVTRVSERLRAALSEEISAHLGAGA